MRMPLPVLSQVMSWPASQHCQMQSSQQVVVRSQLLFLLQVLSYFRLQVLQ